MKLLHNDEKNGFTVEDNLGRLSSGAVLLSKEQLFDPNFEATVVLVCAFSTEGAYGLVLNRPSHMPLSEVFDGLSGLDLKREIYIGGPVAQEELQIVQITDTPVEQAFQLAPEVYAGGKWTDITQMVESNPDRTRLFLGYSGWGPGQLESEVEAGAWDVYRISLKELLLDIGKTVSASVKELADYLESLKKGS
ncbi:MAG: YqgE/AlgH family protein [Chitinispirillaceae bacterium]